MAVVRRINPWTEKWRRRGSPAYRVEAALFYWPGRLLALEFRVIVEPGSPLDRWLSRRADRST